MPEPLIPNIPLFDPTQSLDSVLSTAALLAWHLESGPEHIIPLVWSTNLWAVWTTRN